MMLNKESQELYIETHGGSKDIRSKEAFEKPFINRFYSAGAIAKWAICQTEAKKKILKKKRDSPKISYVTKSKFAERSPLLLKDNEVSKHVVSDCNITNSSFPVARDLPLGGLEIPIIDKLSDFSNQLSNPFEKMGEFQCQSANPFQTTLFSPNTIVQRQNNSLGDDMHMEAFEKKHKKFENWLNILPKRKTAQRYTSRNHPKPKLVERKIQFLYLIRHSAELGDLQPHLYYNGLFFPLSFENPECDFFLFHTMMLHYHIQLMEFSELVDLFTFCVEPRSAWPVGTDISILRDNKNTLRDILSFLRKFETNDSLMLIYFLENKKDNFPSLEVLEKNDQKNVSNNGHQIKQEGYIKDNEGDQNSDEDCNILNLTDSKSLEKSGIMEENCDILPELLVQTDPQDQELWNKRIVRPDKIFLVKITSLILGKIRRLPYLMIREKNIGGNWVAESFGFNKNMQSVIGYPYVCLSDSFEGFRIFQQLKAINWIKFYNEWYCLVSRNTKTNHQQLSENSLVLYDTKKNYVPGTFSLFLQLFFEDRCLKREVYYVFNKLFD